MIRPLFSETSFRWQLTLFGAVLLTSCGALRAEPPVTEPGAPAHLEERWAEQRAAIVERAQQEDWGVGDDQVLRGPNGLEVDLNDCPADWDPQGGVTETAARLALVGSPDSSGYIFPQYYLDVAMSEARADRVNTAGGIGDRELEVIIVDNGTTGVPDRMLSAPDPLAVLSVEIDANYLAPLLREACIPLLLPWSSRDDIGAGPWAVSYGLPAGAEAALWGKVLSEIVAGTDPNLNLPYRVAVVVDDIQAFWLYHGGFTHWANSHPEVVSDITTIPIDQDVFLGPPTTDPRLYQPIKAELAAADPDIVVVLGGYTTCSQLIGSQELASLDVVAGFSHTCTGSMVREQWAVSTNWYSALSLDRGFHRVDVDEAWIEHVSDQVTADDYPADFGDTHHVGINYGWLQLQVLHLANELPGGLNRTNLLLAMWAADFEHPGLPAGTHWTINGPTDPVGQETITVQRWGPGHTELEDVGIVSNEGNSPHCSWDGKRCAYS